MAGLVTRIVLEEHAQLVASGLVQLGVWFEARPMPTIGTEFTMTDKVVHQSVGWSPAEYVDYWLHV